MMTDNCNGSKLVRMRVSSVVPFKVVESIIRKPFPIDCVVLAPRTIEVMDYGFD